MPRADPGFNRPFASGRPDRPPPSWGVSLQPSGDASGATDNAAIQAAIAGGGQIQLSPGVFYVTGTMFLNTGAWFRGAGFNTTTIVMVTNNLRILVAGGYGLTFGDFTLQYATPQTTANTGSWGFSAAQGIDGLDYNGLAWSMIYPMQVRYAYDSFHFPSNFFSNTALMLLASNFANCGFNCESSALGTGSAFLNIYINNGTAACAAPCARIVGFTDGYIGQLNIEHAQPATAALMVESCDTFKIVSLHTEGINVVLDTGCIMHASANIHLKIDEWTVSFCTFKSTYLCATYGNPHVSVDTLHMRDNRQVGGQKLQLIDASRSSATDQPSFEFEHTYFATATDTPVGVTNPTPNAALRPCCASSVAAIRSRWPTAPRSPWTTPIRRVSA